MRLVRIAFLAALVLIASLVVAAEKRTSAPARKAAPKSATKKKAASSAPATKKAATSGKSTAPSARRAPAPAVPAKVRAASREYVEERTANEVVSAIENPVALIPFFERLHRLEQGAKDPVHILHYGDSHTAADEWTGTLRNLFQSRFGDGGQGFSLAGRPFRTYRRLGQRHWMSRGWDALGLLDRDGDGIYGLGGAAIATSRARESVVLDGEAKQAELWYLRQPGGGSLQILDEGRPIETVSTDGPLGPDYVVFSPSSSHIEVETVDRAPVRLFGWVALNGAGVTYETLGINGAQASIFSRWDEEVWSKHLARRDPALVVLAYGTNEASNRDWTFESYREAFSAVLEKIRRAAPAASILVIGPPDRLMRVRGKGWTPFARMNEIVEAQRTAARDNRCAFWDLRERMGGERAMLRWVQAGFAQRDHVHFTGEGYRLIGNVVHRDLMAEFERYRQVRERIFAAEPPGDKAPKP